jgi:hypothetical protein
MHYLVIGLFVFIFFVVFVRVTTDRWPWQEEETNWEAIFTYINHKHGIYPRRRR